MLNTLFAGHGIGMVSSREVGRVIDMHHFKVLWGSAWLPLLLLGARSGVLGAHQHACCCSSAIRLADCFRRLLEGNVC